MAERGGIERVLARIDLVRGLGGLLLVAVIAVAAFRAGGTVGWILGVVLLALCVGLLVALVRRRA